MRLLVSTSTTIRTRSIESEVSPALKRRILEVAAGSRASPYTPHGRALATTVLATSRTRENSRLRAGSCGPSILVMQAAEHWEGDDVPLGRALRGDLGLLMDPLVRADSVVVADVLGDDALEVPGVEYENVVEAFATQRAEEALAHGVHVRRAHRRSDHTDAGGARERIEGGPELVVAIANQEPWRRTRGASRAPQSLFAEAMDRISAGVSGARRDVGRARLRHRQRALKPARCQRRSVSGWTMRRTFVQVGVTMASATKAIRSNLVRRGLATERCRTVSWCLSKAISPSSAQRVRTAAATVPTSVRRASSMGARR
jgi:hypothetical protein